MFSTEEGTASRRLFYSAIFWLVVPTIVGLTMAVLLSYPLVQQLLPMSMRGPINFGRLRPVHVNVAIFGWLSMCYAASILYMVPRLTGAKLYSERLGNIMVVLWNLTMVGVVITFPLGYTQAREYAEMIWPLDIMLLLAFILLGINVWGTAMRRREEKLYVSVWHFMAATVIFPLVYAVGNKVWDFSGAYYGMTDNIVNYFYVHNLFNIWFTAVGLGLAYYLLPKLSGNPLHSHRLAVWGFFGIWAGQHHQLWSPAPDWLEIMTVVFSLIAAVPTTIFMWNFYKTMQGSWHRWWGSVAYRFFALGAIFWAFTCVQGVAQSLRDFSQFIHFTNWVVGHSHLAFVADYSFWGFALVYMILPHMVKRPVFSRNLAEWHFWLTLAGILIYMFSMWIAGWLQALDWAAGDIRFIETVKAMHPYFVARMIGGLMIVVGQVILAYNIWQTARGTTRTKQHAAAVLPMQEAQA